MARIVITSDLHLGITLAEAIHALASQIADERPDLTVLAGDLGEGPQNCAACLAIFRDTFRDLPGRVAVLAGNHDVWARGGRSSQELWERELPQAVREAGMIWLEEQTWQQDGVLVIGSLAWYDYSAADPQFADCSIAEFAARKHEFNLDGYKVNWSWDDVEFAGRLGDRLCARLEAAERDPAVRAILLVTHVPLFEAQMLRRPHDARWGFTNAYFGNLTLGQRVTGARKLRRVVSGHTHVGREGVAPRPDGGEPVPVVVLASDYGKPVYEVIETDEWD